MLSKQNQVKQYSRQARGSAHGVAKERDLQVMVEDYLTCTQLAFIRIPDAVYKAIFGSHTIMPHIKTLISGAIKGLPDITILYPSGRYLCLELKSSTGKQSLGQKVFERSVGSKNYAIACTIDDAIREIEARHG
jgi:hypothetical protein